MNAPSNIRALVTGNPLALAHAIIGDTWTQLILREAFYGVRRFSDWSAALGLPRTVLAGRLKRLRDAGVLAPHVPEGMKRAEYRLTRMGMDLFGTALLTGQWERKHAPSPLQQRYSLSFHDVRTGARISPVVLDQPFGRPIDPRAVTYVEGPGLVAQAPPVQRRVNANRTGAERPMIERSVDIIGDYWTWSIIACAFLRIRRFDDIGEAAGMAPNVLSDRLTRLIESGILYREQYQDNPPRFDYRLTDAGLDLYPIIMAMHGWAERWLCDFDDPPLKLIHRNTGQRITPIVCDGLTGSPLSARYVSWRMEAPTGDREVRTRHLTPRIVDPPEL